MTFEQIIPLLLGLLIGLLIGVMAVGWRNARARSYSLLWLNSYDRLVGGLLILAAVALGIFIISILLRE